MCGIIAIIRRPAQRETPTAARVRKLIDSIPDVTPEDLQGIHLLIESLILLENETSGVPGTMSLLDESELLTLLIEKCKIIETSITNLERTLDQANSDLQDIEKINACIIQVKDLIWSLRNDRVRLINSVRELCQDKREKGLVETFTSIHEALSALDSLEVRGRDSAGLHVMIQGHALDLNDPTLLSEITDRLSDNEFKSGSIRVVDGQISFVYKTASEIGQLGDNTLVLRKAIMSDKLLHRALASSQASAVVVGHTRWASIGIISEPNAHPLNSEQESQSEMPYVVAAMNGDVDNFADLKETEDLMISPAVTSDSKVMPTLMAQHLSEEESDTLLVAEAFRKTARSLQGSVAVVANAASDPENLYLALRGSGQGLYVGLAEDAYIVASEPYGFIERTQKYLRLDGELADKGSTSSEPGEIISLSKSKAGTIEGISRTSYDGKSLPVKEEEIETAGITSRDIDRRSYPHFLLKEITEAPDSFQKTLRGKIIDLEGNLSVRLEESTFPSNLKKKFQNGEFKEIFVIGQGTAAVAGNSLAAFLNEEIDIRVESLPSTELSGFRLRPDMTNTFVVAISQSGTTTDTNRTVDLVRARGGTVVSIVNRRDSELTKKSDGVLYTSDGRDIEMSVASTKAFYSQIAAGFLLGIAISESVASSTSKESTNERTNTLLLGLKELPNLMRKVLSEQEKISEIATELAPAKKYWAIVGNGLNIVAAKEIRIKLSELCYKSIAADFTEDKKHIDLSAEPMILVCAAGLEGSVAADAAKEVAIYRAHKATPIVITDTPEVFSSALKVIEVPSTTKELAFILSTMAGHIFGYEAALSIDAQAIPFREVRSAIELAVAQNPDMTGEVMLGKLKPQIQKASQVFFDGLRSGDYNGNLEASTATKILIKIGRAHV